MTSDPTLTKSAGIPQPKRPKFELAVAVNWAIHPIIAALLEPTRRADGSFPPWVMRLANQITIFRCAMLLLMGPLFVWAAQSHRLGWMCTAILTIAVMFLLDGVDGAVARYTNSQSDFGAILDPMADKIAGASLMIWWLVTVYQFNREQFTMSFWLVILRIALDAALAVIALFEAWRKSHPKAGKWGKIKATCDYVAILTGYVGIIVFAYGGLGNGFTVAAEWMLVVACLFLAPMSIGEHLRSLWRRRRTA